MPNRIAKCAAAALSLLALAGCNSIDPLTRPYEWRPTGVVAHNMEVMAANPDDLVHGRETRVRRVAPDSDGADRLWTGKPVGLLSGGGAGGGGGGGGSGGSSGGGT